MDASSRASKVGKKSGITFFLTFIFIWMSAQDFITVQGNRFLQNGKPYFVAGANLWYAMHLGDPELPGGRERLLRELDRLQSLGINNLRIMAAAEGPDSEPWRVQPALQPQPGVLREHLLQGLDFVLVEMEKRNMTAVVCLNNFWQWSGGMAQYVSWAEGTAIPYPVEPTWLSFWDYMTYTARFYKSEKAKNYFSASPHKFSTRRNLFSARLSREDPTIMAWQLCNEPRGVTHARAYRRWIRESAELIKSLDPQHLLSIGSEGSIAQGTDLVKDHRIEGIDYATFHLWVQNWGWFDPDKGMAGLQAAQLKAQAYFQKQVKAIEKLNMPVVLEEFGLSRDGNDYDPKAAAGIRALYFSFLFKLVQDNLKSGGPLAGANFWAWGGEGRPRTPKAFWQLGDDLLGDPPHEPQGWYSVYEDETGTLEAIRQFALAIQL